MGRSHAVARTVLGAVLSGLWIGALCATCVPGCAGEQQPGTFAVEFRFENDDERPDETMFVFARVEQARGGSERVVIADADPTRYRPGAELSLDRVPNGRDYVVVVELRASTRRRDRVRYFGESDRFAVTPGWHTRVPVALQLISAPDAGAGGAPIEVVDALSFDGRLLVGSRTVSLLLRPTRASRCIVAHDPALAIAQRDFSVFELTPDGAHGAYRLDGWDLDAGLCAEPPCGDGPRRVFVRFGNEQGLSSEVFSTETITLDTSAPQLLTGTVVPQVAPAIGQVDVSVSFDEPVTDVRLDGPLASGFEPLSGDGQAFVWRAHGFGGDVEGSHTLSVSARDHVGNRLEGAPLPALRIDLTLPEARKIAIEPLTLHAGDELGVEFETSEPISLPARVFVGASELECDVESGLGFERFHCTGVVAADERDGARSVQAELSDLAGNRQTVVLGDVEYDVAPPRLLRAVLLRDPPYGPAAAGDETWFSPTDPLTGAPVTATVSVVADKPPNADPELLAVLERDPDVQLTFELRQRATTSAEFSHTFGAGSVVDGKYALEIVWRDTSGGEQARERLPVALQVRSQPPANSVDLARTVYTREPWGSDTSQGRPRFSLSGWVGGDDVHEVLVASRPAVGAGFIIGRAPVQAGRFEAAELTGGNVLEVYVATVDRSGNLSAYARVTEGEWVATLGGKRAGSVVENPHQLTGWQIMPGALGSPDGQGSELDGAALARSDHGSGPAATSVTQGAFHWRRGVGGGVARGLDMGPAHFDPLRGVTVVAPAEPAVSPVGWSWSGGVWQTESVSCRSPTNLGYGVFDPWLGRYLLIDPASQCGDGIAVAPPTPGGLLGLPVYDSDRGRVVMISNLTPEYERSDQVLEWDHVGGWISISPAGERPLPRMITAAAYFPAIHRVVMFGGQDYDYAHHDDLWLWDGDRWTEQPRTDPWPPPRFHAILQYDHLRRRLLLCGGINNQTELRDLWAWDGESWTELASPPYPMIAASASFDPARDRLVAQMVSMRGEVMEWDGARDQWSHQKPWGPTPEFVADAPLVYDAARERLTAYGGRFHEPSGTGHTWVWTGSRWTAVDHDAPRPSLRVSAAMTYDRARERVVLFAGQSTLGDHTDVWEWDGETWRDRTPDAEGPAGGAGVALVYDEALGKVLAFDPLGALWTWDGSNWSPIETTGDAPEPRRFAAAAYDADRGRMVLFGGYSDETFASLNDTWEFDGAQWHRLTPVDAPERRTKAQMIYDRTAGRVLLHGGYADPWSEDPRRDLWEWDGTNWRLLDSWGLDDWSWLPEQPALAYDERAQQAVVFRRDLVAWNGVEWRQRPERQALPGLAESAIAYDSVGDRMLVQAHDAEDTIRGAPVPTATWEWTDSGWRDLALLGPGSAVRFPAMIADPARDRVLAFGGQTVAGAPFVSDLTWEWDGTRWQQFTNQPGGPIYRMDTPLAFDTDRERVVLYGGLVFDYESHPADDGAWLWNGMRWDPHPDASSGPDPQCGHAMAYDSERRRMVLYAPGCEQEGRDPETWEWGEAGWERKQPEFVPPYRRHATMIYDPQRKRSVLIGGVVGEQEAHLSEVWEWDGERWYDISPNASQPFGAPWTLPSTAFDPVRNRVVQMRSVSGAEAWIGDFDSKPAQLAAFTLDALAPPGMRIQPDEVTISARSGAISTEGSTLRPGAMLNLWNGYGFVPAACNDASDDTPDALSYTTRDPYVITPMQVGRALRFALSPIAEHGDGPLATVSTDYIEVRVRYHLGSGSGAIAPQPDRGGEASGSCDPP